MTSRPDSRAATLLARSRAGDAAAAGELFPLLYDELRGLARRILAQERPGHTLQPTALLHEAYLRLVGMDASDVADRVHFVRLAARSMRQVLVDHARRRGAEKRGARRARVTLAGLVADGAGGGVDVLDLDDALAKLAALDERKARVVELRFFAGLSTEEAASLLGIAPKTAEADWYVARAWLRRALDGMPPA